MMGGGEGESEVEAAETEAGVLSLSWDRCWADDTKESCVREMECTKEEGGQRTW